MSKYDDVNENLGIIFVEELFSTIEDENMTENELFKKKLINKMNEIYEFALEESIAEIQDAMDAIHSLKVK